MQPLVELGQQRDGSGLALLPSEVGWLAADLGLDGVQRLDAPHGLCCQALLATALHSLVLLVQVPPRPACVSPAGRLGDPAAAVHAAPAGVGVGLQDAAELAQVFVGMLPLRSGV